uniref:N-acetylglucosamine-specific lectin n=1 Tax=Saxidomus purpurata TaxID=311201 RepID=A0A2Z6G7U3_9BIVA|nr:Chain B, N-acetylglucosamine-specific lectin [Saxidomus purpurata]6A7T_B Chain B, N-acetylglucosamine-specific lectin [Saxidomus purpurata]6M5M_B Chain B, N-acetylglucosamine-specific lectin [Saxidomus purpurata]BBE43065.1 N-acetylglucosamine-specific lectin [Saxidomus purpurata]
MLNGASIIVSLFLCFVGGAYACCSEDDCPSGWKFFGGSCYLFDEGSRGWEGSKAFCESKDASLVTVECSKEDDFIRGILSGQTAKHYYWIGARWNEEHNDYRWIDGSPFTFIGWGPGKPDNNKGCLDYLNYKEVVWQWNDHVDCENTNGPCICEIDCSD